MMWRPCGLTFAIGLGIATLSVAALAGAARAESSEVQAAAQQIAPFRKLPSFVAAGPAFDARQCMKGKSILGIPVSSANPFTKSIYMGMANIAKEVGFRFTEWDNQGQGRPPQLSTGHGNTYVAGYRRLWQLDQ